MYLTVLFFHYLATHLPAVSTGRKEVQEVHQNPTNDREKCIMYVYVCTSSRLLYIKYSSLQTVLLKLQDHGQHLSQESPNGTVSLTLKVLMET